MIDYDSDDGPLIEIVDLPGTLAVSEDGAIVTLEDGSVHVIDPTPLPLIAADDGDEVVLRIKAINGFVIAYEVDDPQ